MSEIERDTLSKEVARLKDVNEKLLAAAKWALRRIDGQTDDADLPNVRYHIAKAIADAERANLPEEKQE